MSNKSFVFGTQCTLKVSKTINDMYWMFVFLNHLNNESEKAHQNISVQRYFRKFKDSLLFLDYLLKVY